MWIQNMLVVNPFQANVPISYPPKTPENQRFSGVFFFFLGGGGGGRQYKMGALARNELKDQILPAQWQGFAHFSNSNFLAAINEISGPTGS